VRPLGALLCLALLPAPLGASPGRALAEDSSDPAAATASLPIAPTVTRLRRWADELASARAETRAEALYQLLALDRTGLPALRARLVQLRTLGVDSRLAHKLTVTRRIQAAARSPSELARQLSSALARDRSSGMLQAVELTCLVQALIAQRTSEAADVLVGGLFVLAPGLLRAEATRARKRLAMLLAPAYLRNAVRPDPAMQRLCRAALHALGVTTPRHAFERASTAVLPALLASYRDLRSRDALPWIIGLVGDARPTIHDAALDAARAFGDGATPLLRHRYTHLLDQPPPPGARADVLLRALAARPLHATHQAIASAKKLTKAEKLTDAEHALSHAVQQALDRETAQQAAAAYFALATRLESQHRLDDALRIYRRALALTPAHALTTATRARILHLEAELRVPDGVLDLPALTEAVNLAPDRPRAAALRFELSGERLAQARSRQRRVGLLAAALLATAAALLLRDARQRQRQAPV
jgi:tetratricopeptide (TPR) repeat protein